MQVEPAPGIQDNHDDTLPTWIPVLFGIFSPVFFSSTTVITKLITQERYSIRFDGIKVSITSLFVIQIFVVVASIIFWNSPSGAALQPLTPHLFIMGTIASGFRTLGYIWVTKAIQLGPAPIVQSIVLASTLLFTVVEAVRSLKTPNVIEIICLIIGSVGFLELVMPDKIEKIAKIIFCCSCCCDEQKKYPKNNSQEMNANSQQYEVALNKSRDE